MSQPSASEMWGTALGATAPSTGGQIGATIMGWFTNVWFWIVVALAVLSLILFIWAVTVTAQRNKLQKAADEAAAAAKTGSYRRQGRYMPDPGIAPVVLPIGNVVTPSGQSQYRSRMHKAGMGIDPDVALKQGLE